METVKIAIKTQTLIKEIKSIRKPKEINPLIVEVEKLVQKQLEGLAVQINFLKQENKRLNGL
tara:strand:+ start:239 stop:424 length:186 start_codon:yes stop_codon:yes gene_type:complete